MLKNLLRIAAERGTVNSLELAQRLNVSRAMVDGMLEELTQRGYLNAMEQNCSITCEQCPLYRACLHGYPPRLWLLTPKGARLLRSGASTADRMDVE